MSYCGLLEVFMQKNVLEWLEATANRLPDKVAFEDVDNTITFKEISDRAKAIGSALTEKVDVRQPIIVISGRNVYTPTIFLGIVYAGCFYAPLDTSAPIVRLNKIIENTKLNCLIEGRKIIIYT